MVPLTPQGAAVGHPSGRGARLFELDRDRGGARGVPCLRVGRYIRFTRPMLEDWLAEQAKP
jgi:hypothetical protein